MTSTVYMFINRLDRPAVCCSHNMDNDGFSSMHMVCIMCVYAPAENEQAKKRKDPFVLCLIDVL